MKRQEVERFCQGKGKGELQRPAKFCWGRKGEEVNGAAGEAGLFKLC